MDEKTIDSIADSIESLESSRTGWIKFLAIAIVLGAIASVYSVAQKIDPNKLDLGARPKCQIVEDTVICVGNI